LKIEKAKRIRRKTRTGPARFTAFLLLLALVVLACFLLLRSGDESAEPREEDAPAEEGREQSVVSPAGTSAEDANARFSDLYYCEPDRLERYLAYEAENPSLDADEVVWRVNADIDKEFYTDVTVVGDVEAMPLLLSKHFKLPDDYEPGELSAIDGGYQVSPIVQEAYTRMMADAKSAGYNIRAGSAYRSIAYQIDLFNRYMREDPENADTYSARPGHSEHHTGRTIDLIGRAGTLRGFVGTKEAAWVRENAHLYGFIVRYTEENEDVTGYMSEDWHVTYVGPEAARVMHDENIGSLEEYVVKYVMHRPPQN
jgi:D-alanyl-D-alanine carboxypeptidase